MGWASRRRLIILTIVVVIIVAILAIFSATIFYKAPSCSDEVQNQGEVGIDCGGPCAYLCTEQVHQPTILFTKSISNGVGRTDVIASVENVNAGVAAKNVPYTVTLYGASQVFVQEVSGTLDLPPAATVPVYVPGIASGNQKVIRAFLSIASTSPKWFSMPSDTRAKPIVSNTSLVGTDAVPRVDAVLTNSSAVDMTNVQVIVFIHSASGDIIAASKTIVPTIPAQGQATATFTWNGPFSSTPAAIEVMPVISLP